ncbi:uncharacterized protein B0H18DRAFT_1009544 [Fomitopsis serialis]|uniref:uncharacterized protein n=1 Tax=Fomitopsis serialis TaxID=139415 RepID=UPI0020077A31|nr:uncharacterized protein B0H18DRAFT_1009544 [Neoantrodia serialis]KAH9925299.1 hypothetical protein B0H18DRAFT_1009544 [Neoantrodia serialis]
MSILTRKRRRSEAFQEDEESHHSEQPVAGEQSEVEAQDGVEESVAEKDDAPDERAKKEREVWDAFREEQYEVLEQLPLSLQRSFALMLELDQQAQDDEKTLVPTVREYISVRKKLASQSTTKDSPSDATAVQTGDERTSLPDDQANAGDIPVQNAPQQDAASTAPPQDSSPEPLASSRQLLTKLANLSEEVVRASNEKVNVARFVYDLADRYIRDLDRAIKEQETSLSLGLRPGTHPASIILPEIVPPTRTRVIQQPPPPSEPIPIAEVQVLGGPEHTSVSVQAEEEDADEDEPMLGIESTESPEHGEQRSTPVRPRRRRSAKWSRKKKLSATPVDGTDKGETPTPEGAASLKLTVPPLASITAHVGNTPRAPGDMSELGAMGDMPIDPNEPCYCYCNQVSFGVMVACDNANCEREWFHLGCVGLQEPPSSKAKWYCRDCTEKMGKKKKGR